MRLTRGCFAPVPVIMTGLLEADNNPIIALIASSLGPGGNDSGEVIDPQDMSLGCTGENSTSIGKSSSTGPCSTRVSQVVARFGLWHLPGAPDCATRIACETILGHSSGTTTLWANLVKGVAATT